MAWQRSDKRKRVEILKPLFIGIDVQVRRGVPWCIMDVEGTVIEADWFSPPDAPEALAQLVSSLWPTRCFVGIDAPRMPLTSPRVWTYTRGRWNRESGKRGRHCELVLKAMGLANPQWTPLRPDAEPWMRLGFSLFEAAEGVGTTVQEVFPTASYRALDRADASEHVSMSFARMEPGPKDMLDAVVAAYTILRHYRGIGSEVGGGDGLGTIILPTPVEYHPIQDWPSDTGELL